MAVRVTYNVNWNTPINDFLRSLRASGGTLAAFTPDGPNGGNPEIAVEFSDQASADIYAAFYHEKSVDFGHHGPILAHVPVRRGGGWRTGGEHNA